MPLELKDLITVGMVMGIFNGIMGAIGSYIANKFVIRHFDEKLEKLKKNGKTLSRKEEE